MAISIEFDHPDLKHKSEIKIPEGLKDKLALKDWIDGLNMSRRAKRAAYRVARRKYKAYNPDFYHNISGKERESNE